MVWTNERVLSFAPDDATAQRGKELSTIRKWQGLSGNERMVWGECKSSGTAYYKTSVDFKGPAFKCTCPSRKFPCKHIIGLMLLFVNNSEAFRISDELSDWVAEWQNKRDQRIDSPDQEKEDEAKQQKKDTAKAQRKAKRLEQMKLGLADVEIWLTDLIRQGILNVEEQSGSFWNDMAARAVDAKLGEIGKRIRLLELIQRSDSNWTEQLLAELSEIFLIAEGYKRIEKLPPNLQNDLFTLGGITIKREELEQQDGLQDQWMVMGEVEVQELDMLKRRTWLYGLQSKCFALLLEYKPVFINDDYKRHWKVGSVLEGTLVYYPSNYPLRAILKNNEAITPERIEWFAFPHFSEFQSSYADALAKNPWLPIFPCTFQHIIPIVDKDKLFLIDKDKKTLPVRDRAQLKWQLIGLSGGHPIQIFGEWENGAFYPLSVVKDGRFVIL